MTRRPPLGTVWRTLVHGHTRAHETYSADLAASKKTLIGGPLLTIMQERTVFDELVIEGVLHVEQMDANYWWIGIPTSGGLVHVDIQVDARRRVARSVMIRDDRGNDDTTKLMVDSPAWGRRP